MKIFTNLQSARIQKIIFAAILFVLAIIVLFVPAYVTTTVEQIGILLVWASLIVFVQSFKRSSQQERNSGLASSLITMLIGFILINIDYLIGTAALLFVSCLFAFDALRQLIIFLKKRKKGIFSITALLSFIGNLIVLLVIFFLRGTGSAEWLMAITAGLRIAGMGFEVLTARLGAMSEVSEDVLKGLRLHDVPGLNEVAQRIEEEEFTRAAVDRRWIITFLFVLFFIHLGRIGFDRSSTGLLSPFIALVGDIFVALIIAFFVIIPIRSFILRNIARTVEKTLWKWTLIVPKEQRKFYSLRRPVQSYLETGLRYEIRIRKTGYSFKTAARTGLQTGLPFAALLAAIIPVFGMSWYFDTENWAAGIWDSWAAARTDTWRSAMIDAVVPTPDAKSFSVQPQGVADNKDFSFIVIGDPGEGDASQYVLSSELVKDAQQPDVKFMVISSDVIYPDGAMKDYERNFWLPLKGLSVPVYAIPGNHDWYDALEGFNATFLDSASARTAMEARRKADLKLTTTTEKNIRDQIAEAGRLRNEYRVPTGYQQAPFFQVQTKDFAFITVETGVLRQIDDDQMAWLKQALEASKGKFIFVLLGHPFYAAGEYQGNMNPKFHELHQMLRDYGATISMAGDTHDMEYYEEPLTGKDTGRTLYHFVNGGGGAYLSIGAALKPKEEMPEKVWAHYPSAAPLIKKIDDYTGWLKRPAWIWTKKYNGWPFSAEWLSAAFDYNKSPFFQSFMEIKVEPSKNQVRVLPYGIFGRLKWSDIEKSDGVKPASVADSAYAEWVFPLHK